MVDTIGGLFGGGHDNGGENPGSGGGEGNNADHGGNSGGGDNAGGGNEGGGNEGGNGEGGEAGNGNGGNDNGGGGENGMPDPEGGGSGGANSSPNPDGGDTDGNDGNSHISLGGHGHGGGDGLGEGVGDLGDMLGAPGGLHGSHGSNAVDPFHNPGEEMPNPDDSGSGGPTSNIAHVLAGGDLSALNAHGSDSSSIVIGGSFWDQAAGSAQGSSLATANSELGGASGAQVSHLMAADSISESSTHDLSTSLDSSAHATLSHGLADAGFAHDAGLGSIALHDLSLGNAFAHQMHI
ncbi:hypothetical protein ACQR1I_15655 [Bradyrhizobium sp. HKCCYLS2038]|uniref:hypothetical protein n=1 Tax=unclassified Bradyrhizobium TaxID=2631580 RepID=UPI003EBD8369